MVEEQLPDFKNKTVLFYLSNAQYDTAIYDPQFETQHGRMFLIGQIIEGCSTNDWLAGLTTSVAWESVEGYVIFESPEDYLARVSLAWRDQQLH